MHNYELYRGLLFKYPSFKKACDFLKEGYGVDYGIADNMMGP